MKVARTKDTHPQKESVLSKKKSIWNRDHLIFESESCHATSHSMKVWLLFFPLFSVFYLWKRNHCSFAEQCIKCSLSLSSNGSAMEICASMMNSLSMSLYSTEQYIGKSWKQYKIILCCRKREKKMAALFDEFNGAFILFARCIHFKWSKMLCTFGFSFDAVLLTWPINKMAKYSMYQYESRWVAI